MIARHFLAGPVAVSVLMLTTTTVVGADVGVARGRIVKTDPAANRLTIRPTSGVAVTLAVTEASRLEIGGKPARLSQFTEGQWVRAIYSEKAGASEVTLLKPAVITDEDLRREVRQALTTAKEYTFQQKDKYQAKLHGVVDDLDDRIDNLEAELKDAGVDARKEFQDRIAELRERRNALNNRLDKVQSATAEVWEDVKSRVGSAAADVVDWLDRILK